MDTGVRLRRVKTITISYYQTVYKRRDTILATPSGQHLENMDPDFWEFWLGEYCPGGI